MRPFALLVLLSPVVAAGPSRLSGPGSGRPVPPDRPRPGPRLLTRRQGLVSADDSTVLVWEAATGRKEQRVSLGKREIKTVAFTPDGRSVLAVTAGKAGKGIALVRIDSTAGTITDDRIVFDRNGAVTLSPDAAWLAVRDDDGAQFRLIATATGREAWSSKGADWRYHCFAFRPDGQAIAGGTLTGRLFVYDLASGKQLRDITVEGGAIWNMVYSPDGKDLVAEVSSPGPNRIVRFDATTGIERWEYRTGRAKDLAFTAAGTRSGSRATGPRPRPAALVCP